MKTNELLFLGDFVDRGFGSLEVILYVLSLKVLSPQHVHLLRGNHETEEINEVCLPTFLPACAPCIHLVPSCSAP